MFESAVWVILGIFLLPVVIVAAKIPYEAAIIRYNKSKGKGDE